MAWIPLCAQQQWERVFPGIYPLKENMDLLSIGVRPITEDRIESVIGSCDGRVLQTRSFNSQSAWEVIDFGVNFDITAILFANDRYIIGGPRGQFAQSVSIPDGMGIDNFKPISLEQLWRISSIPTGETIRSIEAVKGTLLVLAGSLLFASVDEGASWETIDGFSTILSLNAYRNAFYCLEQTKESAGAGFNLWSSTDSKEWSLEWEFDPDGPPLRIGSANLFTLSDYYSPYDHPSLSEERLYACLEGWVGVGFLEGGGTYHDLMLSMKQPGIWFDHSSTSTEYRSVYLGGGHSPGYWSQSIRSINSLNPIGLPEERMGFRPPGRTSGRFAGNYRIEDNLLEAYVGSEWVVEFASNSNPPIPDFLVTTGITLSYIHRGAEVVVHQPDGSIEGYAIPDELTDEPKFWSGWMQKGEGYYGLVDQYFVSTADFINWKTHFRVYRESILLDGKDYPRIALANLDELPGKSERRDVYFAMRKIIKSENPDELTHEQIALPANVTSVCYVPHSDAYYTLRIVNPYQYPVEQRFVIVERVFDDSSVEPFVQFVPESWNGYFDSLVCPDGSMLIAFGDSAEMAIMDTEGNLHMAHPWQFFPSYDYRIENITYADGWYYIFGGTTIRTRDFIEFERVREPLGESLNAIVEWEGKPYGFSSGAVFQLRNEPLYLGSSRVAENWGMNDWLRNDWLGTFYVINQDKDTIEHLQLGVCWVKPVNGSEYWINSDSLGWIYMSKLWAPWIYRLSNGQWYWLDTNSWPGRAWDDFGKVWLQLNP